MNYEIHGAANIFPMLADAQLAELAADIKANGLREAIKLYQGKVIDGRNRLAACERAGVEPRFEVLADDLNPIAYVISINLHRRHLTESQRAMVAAKIADMGSGARTDIPTANLQEVSRAAAAEMLNVSERSVNSAKKVQRDGASELVDKVVSGAVSVSAAADVATLPKTEQTEIVAKGEREILEAAKKIRAQKAVAKREERLEKIEEISRGNTELDTSRRYPVIYADPPWRYENPPMGGTNRSIENHYPTMTLDEICALPVGELAADDAILYLWATAPKLEECFEVIKSWGFEYRTNIVWDKEKIGMGYHARNQHELLLICKRGNMPPPQAGKQPSSVHREARGVHSAKPDFYYEMIEGAYPDIGRIELFCRSPREGWAVWGNQVEAAE